MELAAAQRNLQCQSSSRMAVRTPRPFSRSSRKLDILAHQFNILSGCRDSSNSYGLLDAAARSESTATPCDTYSLLWTESVDHGTGCFRSCRHCAWLRFVGCCRLSTPRSEFSQSHPSGSAPVSY